MVKLKLDQEKEKGQFSVPIITGISSVLQKLILNKILEGSEYKYYIPITPSIINHNINSITDINNIQILDYMSTLQ